MLKIKDNVDLKELAKFGFKYTGNYNRGDRWERNGIDYMHDVMVQGDWANREITYSRPYVDLIRQPVETLIKDLIDNNLVEKVEEEW